LQDKLREAKAHFDNLLTEYPNSPRAMYSKAATLEKLAEKMRSNKLLEEAIALLQKVMDAKEAPDGLVKRAGLMLGEKLNFRGKCLVLRCTSNLFYP
jgi:tetratricopeptide (TPR) repeat protein